MPKNRDYTGLVRTPSSMAWLIGHRARTKGRLDRLRRLEGTLPDKIKAAEAELAAIDAVIPLHEVKIDPQVIKGCQPQAPRLAAHGVMTRCILKRLRLAEGKAIYTSELALQFARDNDVDLRQFSQAELMDRVNKLLRKLTVKGVVRRHHDTATTGMGSWSLVMDD